MKTSAAGPANLSKYLPKYLGSCFLLPLLCAPALAQAGPSMSSHGGGDAHDDAPAARIKGGYSAAESNVDFFWRQSDEAFHKGDYERAIFWHRAIVALEPGDVQSWGVAAWLMWSLGHGDEATAWIARGLQANPDSWEMRNEAAEHYELQKLQAQALEAYKAALSMLPADADRQDAQLLRRRLAHAAERAGDLSLSAQTWRDLARDYPDEAVNKNNLARVEALLPR